jgi:maleate isomerase
MQTTPGSAGEIRLGLIVPSSNTNAEPLSAAMLAGTGVTALASRFALPLDLNAVIDSSVLGPAADLLTAAGVSAMAFHGTSGCWLGLGRDDALAAELAARTGVATTTASLATVAALKAVGARSVGMVFPGPTQIADSIASEFGAVGLDVVSRAVPRPPLGNPEISELTFDQIEELVLPAAAAGIDALVCVGTNLRAAYLADRLEERLGVPVIDSAAAVVWQLLRLVDKPARCAGWGILFSGRTGIS